MLRVEYVQENVVEDVEEEDFDYDQAMCYHACCVTKTEQWVSSGAQQELQ